MYKIIIASCGRHKKANGFLSTISCLRKIKNIKKQGGIKRIPTNKQWNFLRGMGRMVKICMNYTRIGNTFNSAPPILARQQKTIQTNRYNWYHILKAALISTLGVPLYYITKEWSPNQNITSPWWCPVTLLAHLLNQQRRVRKDNQEKKKKYTSPVIASFSSNRTLMLSCEQKLGKNAMILVSGKMEYPWGFHFYFKEM